MTRIVEGVTLSPLAAGLLDTLEGPAKTDYFPEGWPDVSQLGDEELGVLLSAAYVSRTTSPRFMVEEAASQRQVRFSPGACRRMFEVLVEGLPQRKWADLALGLAALLRCTGPLPQGLDAHAGTLVRYLLGVDRTDDPYRLLATAVVAGGDLYQDVSGLLAADSGSIVSDELRLLRGWDADGHALMAELSEVRYRPAVAPLPDRWRRLADTDYPDFGRRALEAAEARIAAVQSGEIPYRADRAFTSGEVAVLGRAVRVALLRDEPWLPELLDRLLRGVAVAPTPARTLPSQALLYEVTRAAQDFPIPELVSTLRTIRTIVRHAGVPKQLDKQLKKIEAALADRIDVALRLPDLGFEPGGVLRTRVGEHEAVITAADDVTLEWRRQDGRVLSGLPAAVRRDHGDVVKDLRELVKRVRAQLTTLARALEGGFSADTVQPYGKWRTELAAHPLAGTVVRRLIWEVEVARDDWRAVFCDDGGGLRDSGGRPLPAVPDEAPLRLWHPIRSGPGEVRAWRDLLTERRVRQPFKQAFREIYLLTPAEEQTRIYSNRFAAHLVHYDQLFALLRARGWRSDLLGPWDGGGEDQAERTFAAGEWLARFFHEYAHWAAEGQLAATDQVRFARRENGVWRDAPLADVPATVFSEAMRDVDLFVGVTSIAADPNWTDLGEGRARDYWERVGFGELTATAEMRRDALERIVPRTKIADRCAIEGRYLVVRGDLRTYKIHLGSANILMEPDDSYLCIVPAARKGDGNVFLPFEDARLALILSKAFLLAADAKITDETILLQIKRVGA